MDAEPLLDALTRHGCTLALAESYTGGLLHDAFLRIPGASRAVHGGLVTYSDEAKRDLLDVTDADLRRHGAVSEAVARVMAEGARRRFRTDYGLAATGIAGPTGSTASKPLGLAYVAAAGPHHDLVHAHQDEGDRDVVRRLGVEHALACLHTLLRRDGLL